MNLPKIKDEIELLRKFKTQTGFTNAVLATDMTSFGWTILEALLDDWTTGRKHPTAEHREYIRLYLLNYYYAITIA